MDKEKKKMRGPSNILDLYMEILNHIDYPKLTARTRFEFNNCCVWGSLVMRNANEEWATYIWAVLNEIEEYDDGFLEKRLDIDTKSYSGTIININMID